MSSSEYLVRDRQLANSSIEKGSILNLTENKSSTLSSKYGVLDVTNIDMFEIFSC